MLPKKTTGTENKCEKLKTQKWKWQTIVGTRIVQHSSRSGTGTGNRVQENEIFTGKYQEIIGILQQLKFKDILLDDFCKIDLILKELQTKTAVNT